MYMNASRCQSCQVGYVLSVDTTVISFHSASSSFSSLLISLMPTAPFSGSFRRNLYTSDISESSQSWLNASSDALTPSRTKLLIGKSSSSSVTCCNPCWTKSSVQSAPSCPSICTLQLPVRQNAQKDV